MPFVHKDAQGKILAVYTDPVEGTQEVASDDAGLVAFIQQNIPGAVGGVARGGKWMESDLALARVIEDLIEILIDKKLIMVTDFPASAQKKLLDRRGLRKEFDLVEDLFEAVDEGGDKDGGTGGLL